MHDQDDFGVAILDGLRALLVVVTLILLLAGCTVGDSDSEARDDGESAASTVTEQEVPIQELLSPYRSSSDQFETSHPATWMVDESFEDGAVVLANTADAIDRYRSGARPTDDDVVVNVGFLPAALFEQRELRRYDVTIDLAPDDFLRAILPIFVPIDDATIGDIELLGLDNGQQAGAATVTAPDREGRILTVPAGPQVVAIISTMTAPGQNERFDDVVGRIAASTVFHGDGDALYGRLLTG